MSTITKRVLLLLAALALLGGALLPHTTTASAAPEQFKSYDHLDMLRAINKDRGKVVIVNFFASWCQPCRIEVPVLVRLRKEFSEDEVSIKGFSIDEDPQALALFVKRMDFNYPVHLATAMAQRVFQVSSIPATLIYDKSGKLVLAHQGLLTYEMLHGSLTNLTAQ